jgi:hypothetical protein
MVAVRSAWTRAWETLDVEACADISRDDGRLPADYLVKAIFSSLFGELGTTLRSSTAITRGACSEVQAELIETAVAAQRERLEAVGRLVTALRPGVAERGLAWTKERDPMARLALRLADTGGDEGLAGGEQARHYEETIPDADGVRATLRDNDLVSRLADELRRKGTFEVVHGCVGDCVLDALLDDFLDADLVAVGGEPSEVDGEPQWAALRGHECLPSNHSYARGLGLTRHDSPKVPAVRATRPASASWHQRHRLDASLQERVEGALRGERQQRIGLPDEAQLLVEETDRVARPLGLGTDASLATLALARRLLFRLTVPGDDTSRVVTAVRAHFAGWHAEMRKVGAYARLPGDVRNAAEDPVKWYVSLLWRRLHGHETRRVLDGAAASAHLTLTGISVTVVERLRQAPGGLSTGIDDVERTTGASTAGRSGSVLPAEVSERDDIGKRVTETLRAAARVLGPKVGDLVDELYACHRAEESTEETWDELADGARRAGHVPDVTQEELDRYLRLTDGDDQ